VCVGLFVIGVSSSVAMIEPVFFFAVRWMVFFGGVFGVDGFGFWCHVVVYHSIGWHNLVFFWWGGLGCVVYIV
jgi:hypothetical protein